MSLPPENMTLEQRRAALGLKSIEDWEAELKEQSSWSGFLDPNFTAGVGWTVGSFIGMATTGPILGAVSAVSGLIGMFWGKKAAREQRLAYYAQQGIEIQRRPYASRSVLYRDSSLQFAGQHSDIVAEVLVEVLRKDRPDLSLRQLRRIGNTAMNVFREFTMKFSELPVEIAADSVLAIYGVFSNTTALGEREYYYRTPGTPAVPPETPTDSLLEDEKKDSTLLYWILAGLIVIVLSRR